MDAREELKRWIAMVVQLSSEEESTTIKPDIDLFLSVAGELSGKLAERNTALAKQCRSSSKAKPPKPAPQKAQKQPKSELSTAKTPKITKRFRGPFTGAEQTIAAETESSAITF